MLCPVDRARSGLMDGVREHALPGAVLEREGPVALAAGKGHVVFDSLLLQAALEAPPAAEAFGVFAGEQGPEVEGGIRKVEGGAYLFPEDGAHYGDAGIADERLQDAARGEKFLEVVEGNAALPGFPEIVTEAAALGEGALGRGEEHEEPAHGGCVSRAGVVLEGVVQAFPVAGTEDAFLSFSDVDIGEIGRDGTCGGGGRRKRSAGPDDAAHGPEPPGEAGDGAQGSGRPVIDEAQAALRLFRGGLVILREGPAAGFAHGFKGCVAGGSEAVCDEASGAPFLHDHFKGAQAVDVVELRRDLGMALVEKGAPPHGKRAAAAQGVREGAAACPGAACLICPRGVFAADGDEAVRHLPGKGDGSGGDVPGVEARLGGAGAQIGGSRAAVKEDFGHGYCSSLAKTSRMAAS